MTSRLEQPVARAIADHSWSLALTIASLTLLGGCVTEEDPIATSVSTGGPNDTSGPGGSTVEADSSDSSAQPDPDCYPHTTPDACAAAGAPCRFVVAREVALIEGECVLTTEYGEVGWCTGEPYGGTDLGTWEYEISTGRVFYFRFHPITPIPGWAECACEEGEPPACLCAPCFTPPGTTGSTGASTTATGDTSGVTTSSG